MSWRCGNAVEVHVHKNQRRRHSSDPLSPYSPAQVGDQSFRKSGYDSLRRRIVRRRDNELTCDNDRDTHKVPLTVSRLMVCARMGDYHIHI